MSMSISSLLGTSSSTPSSTTAATANKETPITLPRTNNTHLSQQAGLPSTNTNVTAHLNTEIRTSQPNLRSFGRPVNNKKHGSRDVPTNIDQPKTPTVSSELVHANIKYLPRYRLGTLIYEPLSDPFLPRFEGRENSLVNVKIPRRLLSRALNENVGKRKVWGTDIYTDDSDVVAALYHAGYVPTVLAGEAGDLTEIARIKAFDKKTTAATGLTATLKDNTTKKNSSDTVKNLTPTPDSATDGSAPGSVEADGDCLVTLLILPPLKLYKGTFRNGYNSRSWLTKHDGVSFAIHKVKFIPRGDIEATYSLRKRRIGEWEEEWQDAESEFAAAKHFKTGLVNEVPTDGSGLKVSAQ